MMKWPEFNTTWIFKLRMEIALTSIRESTINGIKGMIVSNNLSVDKK